MTDGGGDDDDDDDDEIVDCLWENVLVDIYSSAQVSATKIVKYRLRILLKYKNHDFTGTF